MQKSRKGNQKSQRRINQKRSADYHPVKKVMNRITENYQRHDCFTLRVGMARVGLAHVKMVVQIEKKPLYHFYPGTNILSVGSYGCNMRCDFCQNYNISQHTLSSYSSTTDPYKIISDAHSALNNAGIAFTYNEPVIWFEFIRDVAVKARKNGNGICKTSRL